MRFLCEVRVVLAGDWVLGVLGCFTVWRKGPPAAGGDLEMLVWRLACNSLRRAGLVPQL